MDTRCWGPSAWIFLHSIAENVGKNNSLSRQMKDCSFFVNLEHILPCIHCRISYTQFLQILPFNKDTDIGRNLYLIHNKVNRKLALQGYKVTKSSNYRNVRKQIITRTSCFDSENNQSTGYTFIGSVVYNFPAKEPSKILQTAYCKFFKALPIMYPTSMGRKKWKLFLRDYPINDYVKNRKLLINWFSRSPMMKYTLDYPQGKVQIPITKLNKHFETFRAGCKTQSCRNRGTVRKLIYH